LLGLARRTGRPEEATVARSFEFGPPAMAAADWRQFGDHLRTSAANFENTLRGQGLARVRDPLAVVRGIAGTVAATAPGERVPPMTIRLSAADERLVRAWLSRSLARAGDESASGDRPGHNDAARCGVGSLLDQWESFIGAGFDAGGGQRRAQELVVVRLHRADRRGAVEVAGRGVDRSGGGACLRGRVVRAAALAGGGHRDAGHGVASARLIASASPCVVSAHKYLTAVPSCRSALQ